MLVVSDPISNEAQLANPDGNMGKLNIDDYIWPHGITPPLRHVRKRRFRKRISRRVSPARFKLPFLLLFRAC
jgi:transcription initiation factor TFIID subunit 7